MWYKCHTNALKSYPSATQYPILVFTLAPDGPRISAGTVLTTKVDWFIPYFVITVSDYIMVSRCLHSLFTRRYWYFECWLLAVTTCCLTYCTIYRIKHVEDTHLTLHHIICHWYLVIGSYLLNIMTSTKCHLVFISSSCDPRASIYTAGGRFIARSREVSKLRD